MKGLRDSFVRTIFMAWKVESFYHFNSRKDSAPTPPADSVWQVFSACIEGQGPKPSLPGLRLLPFHMKVLAYHEKNEP
jgi:hypothetical protein